VRDVQEEVHLPDADARRVRLQHRSHLVLLDLRRIVEVAAVARPREDFFARPAGVGHRA
jgi:hypothetical protein